MSLRVVMFAKTIGLLTLLAFAAAALVCGISYALSKDRKPVFDVEPTAAVYIRQSLFPVKTLATDFSERLGALADRTKTSVLLRYVERPRAGETVSSAIESNIKGIEKKLDGLPPGYQKSAIAIVLVGKPRSFAVIGFHDARTRLYLRALSSKALFRSLQYRHTQSDDGRFLMQVLEMLERDLRPLNFFIEYHPYPPLVAGAIQMATGDWAAALPGGIVSTILMLTRPLVSSDGLGVSPLIAFVAKMVMLALVLEITGAFIAQFARRYWLQATIRAAMRMLVIVPIIGVVAIVAYGSLEDLASLSQISGEDFRLLARTSKALNSEPLTVNPVLGLVAAYIITLGISLELARGDPELLMSGAGFALLGPAAIMFSEEGQPFAFFFGLALLVAIPALIIALPMALLMALFSMEGLMGFTLLPVLAVQWGRGVVRFWRVHEKKKENLAS